jgi:hypothetical protein
MLGRAFSEDTTNYLAIDLINVFFWGALAEIARDFSWREPQLAGRADYLSWPLRHVGIVTSTSGLAILKRNGVSRIKTS